MKTIVAIALNPAIDKSACVAHVVAERKLYCQAPHFESGGAGDSMMAGIVLSLARGNPLRESLLFSMAAGTAAVMTAGTQLCRREDAERLYAEMIAEAGA